MKGNVLLIGSADWAGTMVNQSWSARQASLTSVDYPCLVKRGM